jgi:hypothetical protein
MVKSSTSPKGEGFLPLHGNMNQPYGQPTNYEHIVNIPLTPIMTNASTGARKEGQTMSDYPRKRSIDESPNGKAFRGRRRTKDESGLLEEGALTTMGKFYDKILHFSIITRYIIYILPLALCLLVPILVSIYAAPKATIGGVRILWFFVWVGIMHSQLLQT